MPQEPAQTSTPVRALLTGAASIGANPHPTADKVRALLSGWDPENFRDPNTQPGIRAVGAVRDLAGSPLGQLILAALPFFKAARPTADLVSEPDYLYHATNLERATAIADSQLRLHKPWQYTDQSSWPDWSTQRRAYFSPNAGGVWAFAPEEGSPVILRTRQQPHFRTESGTGDVYTTKPVSSHALEILGHDGTWYSLAEALGSAPPTPPKGTP